MTLERQLPQALRGLLLIAVTVLASTAHAVLGDRLIVGINGVPYTQSQIETYIHIKESLRKTMDGNVRVISSANWDDAISVFTEDMIILQESQRLGSFSAPDQALDKYLSVIREKLAKGEALRATFARLGIDDASLGHSLEDVLRVAAFRRSKERQDAQAGEAPAARERPKWLVELSSRAVVRRYEGADTYVTTFPNQGSAGGVPTP